jgi:hypothetical protein
VAGVPLLPEVLLQARLRTLLRAMALLPAEVLLRAAALLLRSVAALRLALRLGLGLTLGLRLGVRLTLPDAPVLRTLGPPGRQRLPARREAAGRQPSGVGVGPLRPRRLEYR